MSQRLTSSEFVHFKCLQGCGRFKRKRSTEENDRIVNLGHFHCRFCTDLAFYAADFQDHMELHGLTIALFMPQKEASAKTKAPAVAALPSAAEAPPLEPPLAEGDFGADGGGGCGQAEIASDLTRVVVQ
jgi:hypothetical protein